MNCKYAEFTEGNEENEGMRNRIGVPTSSSLPSLSFVE